MSLFRRGAGGFWHALDDGDFRYGMAIPEKKLSRPGELLSPVTSNTNHLLFFILINSLVNDDG